MLNLKNAEEQLYDFLLKIRKIKSTELSFRATNPFFKLDETMEVSCSLCSRKNGCLVLWDSLSDSDILAILKARQKFPVTGNDPDTIILSFFDKEKIIGAEPFSVEAIIMVFTLLPKPSLKSPLFDLE